MGRILDERGNLFGIINIVDAFSVLAGVIVVSAGLALVSETIVLPVSTVAVGAATIAGVSLWDVDTRHETRQENTTRYLQMQISGIEPAVAKAINPGDTTVEEDLTVTDVWHEPSSVVVETGDGTLVEQQHPRLWTTTIVTETHSPESGFRGDRLFVGRELRLDLSSVRVDATIVALDDNITDWRERESEEVVLGDPVRVSVSE